MRDYKASISGPDRLIESLWRDAQREADQEILKARSEADRLVQESNLLREREMALADERARDEAMPQVSRIMNQARNRVRQLVLEGRHAFLDSCFDDVLKLMGRDNILRESFRSALGHLLEQALSDMGDRNGIEVLVNPADLENTRRILKEAGIAFDLTADKNISGGARLSANGGSTVVDNTVEGRLGVMRETPPIDLLKLISPKRD